MSATLTGTLEILSETKVHLGGADPYNPATGRFLSTGPIDGGNPNPYVYPTDPINGSDLTGQWGWPRWVKSASRWASSHRSTIAMGIALIGCAGSGGLGCAALAAGAFAVRAQQRGYRNVNANARDAILTGAGFGLGRSFSYVRSNYANEAGGGLSGRSWAAINGAGNAYHVISWIARFRRW